MVETRDIVPITGIIIFVAIFIGIGVIILQNIGHTAVQNVYSCVAVNNDSFTVDNTSGVYTSLDHPEICVNKGVYNYSNSSKIWTEGTDYTIDYLNGRIYWLTIYNGTSMSMNYTYGDVSKDSYVFLNRSSVALGDFSTWWPLIILAFMIGLAMFFVIRSFTGDRIV